LFLLLKAATPLLLIQRLTGIGVLLISWVILQFSLGWMHFLKQPALQSMPLRITHWWCKAALWWMNVRISQQNHQRATAHFKGANPVFLAANHVSWLDPLIMFSCTPSRFVTSRDIGAHPFLGFVTRLGGCFFMSRNAAALRSELKEIRSAGAQTLAFYPEATSGDGSSLLPFKSALFEISVQGKIPVIPLTINYQSINGHAVNLDNRDSVYYYGDMYFAPHFFHFMTLWSVDVELCWEAAIQPIEGWDRKQLNQLVWQKVAANFSPIAPCETEGHDQNCPESEVRV